MTELGPLSKLAMRHGSDKWPYHEYTPNYERAFAPYRDQDIKFLEIGIGGYTHTTEGGQSLKMWRDYFPAAQIYALDLFDKTAQATDRIKIYQGNQTDPEILFKMHTDAGGFDIVVDDGSHRSPDVIATFKILFPLLNTGGLYIVEDTQTSYWPLFGGSSEDPDSTATTMGFFKSLVHGLNHAELTRQNYQPSHFDNNISAIMFCHNMILVYKGDNSQESKFPQDHPYRVTSTS